MLLNGLQLCYFPFRLALQWEGDVSSSILSLKQERDNISIYTHAKIEKHAINQKQTIWRNLGSIKIKMGEIKISIKPKNQTVSEQSRINLNISQTAATNHKHTNSHISGFFFTFYSAAGALHVLHGTMEEFDI